MHALQPVFPSRQALLWIKAIDAIPFLGEIQGVPSWYAPGPTPRMREPLGFCQITLAPPQRFFHMLVSRDVHHRSNKFDAVRFIVKSMSHHMDVFDGTIRHQQAMFKIKILPMLRRPFDCLLHEPRVFRMNPLENKFYAGFRRSVVLEDSKSFL